MTVGFVRLRVFSDCQFSMTVDFVLLQDLNDGRFCSFVRYQLQLVLFFYEILVMVDFVPLRDFKDGQFCSVAKFQWRWVLFLLRDFKDGQFCSVTRSQWRLVLFGYEFSVTVSFQWRLGLFYKISMTVGFVPLWDINDSLFCSFTRY